jgi:hypothetical protein
MRIEDAQLRQQYADPVVQIVRYRPTTHFPIDIDADQLMTMATLLWELPDHLIFMILRLLPDADLLKLNQTCKACRAICDEDEPVWGPRCAVYGIDSHQGWARSFKRLYLSLICRYGRLLRPHGRDGDDAVALERGARQEGSCSETLDSHSVSKSRPPAAARGLWYALDAPFGGLLTARAEPPAIVLYRCVDSWTTLDKENRTNMGH